jgi:hypothetical protein
MDCRITANNGRSRISKKYINVVVLYCSAEELLLSTILYYIVPTAIVKNVTLMNNG